MSLVYEAWCPAHGVAEHEGGVCLGCAAVASTPARSQAPVLPSLSAPVPHAPALHTSLYTPPGAGAAPRELGAPSNSESLGAAIVSAPTPERTRPGAGTRGLGQAKCGGGPFKSRPSASETEPRGRAKGSPVGLRQGAGQ